MISDPHFESDPFPGCPKILFIGIAGSSHTVSWINLLSHARINVRLFGVPNRAFPPPGWDVRTYLSTPHLPEGLDSRWSSCIYSTPEEARAEAARQAMKAARAEAARQAMEAAQAEAEKARAEAIRKALQASWALRFVCHLKSGIIIKPYESDLLANIKNSLLGLVASPIVSLMNKFGLSWKDADRLLGETDSAERVIPAIAADNSFAISEVVPLPPSPEEWLARIVREWRPDIVHTFGLTDDQGGLFYDQVRQKYHLAGLGQWVLQLRGGSDLTLNRHDPLIAGVLSQALKNCDQIVSDNTVNADYIAAMGVSQEKIAPISPVPGTGGIDIGALRKTWTLLPSQRERLILWPKAYDCIWSVALPVFEALKIAWERIKPCRIVMLCMTTETTKMWFEDLPEEIRKSTQIFDRIPRNEAVDFMRQARVMLAPSLVDGIPNVLYEAMACGAFPIVSPIETISRVVVNERHGFLARNLFPDEIAEALIRAMSDDTLVDETTLRNLAYVEKLADRSTIESKVVAYYMNLARGSQGMLSGITSI